MTIGLASSTVSGNPVTRQIGASPTKADSSAIKNKPPREGRLSFVRIEVALVQQPLTADSALLNQGQAPSLPISWSQQWCSQRRCRNGGAEQPRLCCGGYRRIRPDHKVAARQMNHVRHVHGFLSSG